MHTLDPAVFDPAAIPDETHALNASIVAQMTPMPEWWDIGADSFRASRKSGKGVFPAPVLSPRARDQVIAGPGGPLTLRILPPVGPSRGVYLHIHGGGWVLGAADEQDRLLEVTADTTGLTAVSVEYRLAPEYPFPAGPDDCEAAALWVLEHLADFGGDRFAIGGESAGAHLATLTLLRLRDRHGGSRCHAANLTFGAFDIAQTPSARAADDERLVLRGLDMRRFGDAFLPGVSPEDRRDPGVSPLYADLSNLCPAIFTVGTRDPLLDDSLFIQARWMAAGNAAVLRVYPGAAHGFVAFPSAQTRQWLGDTLGFLKATLDAA